MAAIECAQRLGAERLHADAHTVHAVGGGECDLVGGPGLGRRFDRELGAGRRKAASGDTGKPLVDRREQPAELVRRQVRRRAATDEDALDRARLAERGEFGRERVKV